MKFLCKSLEMIKRIILILLICIVAVGIYLAFIGYKAIYGEVLELDSESITFYIYTGWEQEEVVEALVLEANLKSPEMAKAFMDQKNYRGSLIVPGKYTLQKEMGLNELVDHLRAGNGEEEVDLTINYIRKIEELPSLLAKCLEADSAEFADYLLRPDVAQKYGFSSTTFLSMFLPDTYKMEWDSNPEEFTARMVSEYKKYWSDDRKRKASAIGLSQSEVSTLASIVQAEQQVHAEERKTIAGLYLNRLRKRMRLQSDPTVVYALGDFTLNRVLSKHLSTSSLYNTYIHQGLPPGPINLPSKQSIDAVLNAESNNYLFMCAKSDFSGYHAFADNLSQHNRNARAFQNALNQRRIFR